jgi:hypothetical protein
VIGKREADGKCNIWDVLITPDLEDYNKDIKKKFEEAKIKPSAQRNL